MDLTHVDPTGAARMVDVTDKAATHRSAVATGVLHTTVGVLDALRRDGLPKGDALATARIAGILANAEERKIAREGGDVSLLAHPSELELIRKMLQLPELVHMMASQHEPHHLPHYAQDLATAFHAFYTDCRVLDDENLPLSQARLRLCAASKVALARALTLMGMSAPERM